MTQGKESTDTEGKAKKAANPPKVERNLEIGRNAYEPNGKEIVAAASKGVEKQANGDASTANGTSETTIKALDDIVKGPEEKINCYTCGIDCTRLYYHNGKTEKDGSGSKAKYNVCPNCFIELRLPANQDSGLYVKMENPAYSSLPDRDAPWSDRELLLLLEGLEKFDESWADIAEHVGTRTREECVVKFLQLDIEDKYLDAEPPVSNATSMGLLGSQGQIPFSQADNPVMSVVGYMASLADPAVAAAAAGKSLDILKQGLRDKLENPTEAKTSDKGKEKESDMMELDIRQETTTTTTTTTSISGLATIPIAASAARAGALASHEEREMTRLVSAAVNTTLQKLELKLQQFNEMEEILQAERRELERGRQQLFLDRLSFKKRVKDVQEGLRMAAVTGGDQGIKMAQDVMSSSEKLAFVSNVTPGAENTQPLSAEGTVKTYDI